MQKLTILVTGGAGYIGSHMLLKLQEAGHEAIVIDNLSTGHKDSILHGNFYEGDIADSALLERIFSTHSVDAVMHFAAFTQVEESMRERDKYWRNNVENTQALLDVMMRHQVHYMIFSSTAAIFGSPAYLPIDEEHPAQPVNVYGETKLAVEKMLAEYSANGLYFGCLRYFNAAGADPKARIGERHEPETHLIPLVLDAALGKHEVISIFGDDYETRDGSCIRDYIHVNDLCDAHLLLLNYLQQGGAEKYFNLGTGQGFSVKEVIAYASDITGEEIPSQIQARRAGDPAILIANGEKAKELLGWEPERSDIKTIIQDAWNFKTKP